DAANTTVIRAQNSSVTSVFKTTTPRCVQKASRLSRGKMAAIAIFNATSRFTRGFEGFRASGGERAVGRPITLLGRFAESTRIGCDYSIARLVMETAKLRSKTREAGRDARPRFVQRNVSEIQSECELDLPVSAEARRRRHRRVQDAP